MSKFFFDIVDDGVLVSDPIGADLADERDACQDGISLLPCITKGLLLDGHRHEIVIVIRDRLKKAICRFTLAIDGCPGTLDTI